MNRLKTLSVTALATAMLFAAAMPGACGARRRARENLAATRIYTQTAFINQGDAPIRVTVVVGERLATPPGIGSTFVGQPQMIAPGGTYNAVLQEKKPYGAGFLFPEGEDLVVRFKVESSGATWEAATAAWFEVVGPVPVTIRLLPGDGVSNAAGEGGRIELVPAEWWPEE